VAKPGDVVISQNTFDQVKGIFETKSMGEFPLKGLQQKMPVYTVLSEIEPAAVAAETPPAFARNEQAVRANHRR
jgi:class 3 adenylate cyclase